MAMLVTAATGLGLSVAMADGPSTDPMGPEAIASLVAAIDADCRASVPDSCAALRHLVMTVRSHDRAAADCRLGRRVGCDAAGPLRLRLQFAALDSLLQESAQRSGVESGGVILMPPGALNVPDDPIGPYLPATLSPEALAPGKASDAATLDAWLGRRPTPPPR